MANIPIDRIGNAELGQHISQENPLKNKTEGNFEAVINEAMGKVSQIQNDVEKAVGELASGGDIANAIIAVEKADMTFQLMVEIRNKLIRTYEEIMRMQV